MTLPPYLLPLFYRYRQAGYGCYAVGGCVRDSLMGRCPQDYDLCTDATPEQTLSLFADYRCIPTGLRHGTVTVLAEGHPVEITTFSTEGSYTDGRRPDWVAFTPSLEEDLSRRDFTVNAMAYSPTEGLIDPFGGQADLQKGMLRCVGDPAKRFSEDALRILRCLRFASVLGFSIHPDTARALKETASRLKLVSGERIGAELKKLLCGKQVREVLLNWPEVLGVVLPEILPMVGCPQRNPYHKYDVWGHTAAAVEAIPPKPELRLTMLFHDAGKPACAFTDEEGVDHFYGHGKVSAQLAQAALTRLKWDRATLETVVDLCLLHDRVLVPTLPAVKRLLHKIGPERLEQLILVKEADTLAQSALALPRMEQHQQIRRLADQILEEQSCFSRKDLAVNGKDLLAEGVPAGPAVGQRLEALLNAVMDGKIPNERTALLKYLREEKPWT